MPLFFLVSGAATWFSLASRNAGRYISERVKRLLVPLIFGTLAVVPIQVYWMRMSKHEFAGSYFRFYPHFFNGIAPQGNFEWGHLWFLAYLFVFSLVALPLFLFLRKEAGRALITRFAALCEGRGRVFVFAIPLAVIQAALRARWPGFQNLYDDWANFAYYLTFFIYGYLLCSEPGFRQAVRENGKLAFLMGIGSTSAIFLLYLTGNTPSPDYSFGWVLLMVLHGFNSWFWIVAILSLADRRLNFTNKVLEYANEAALPFYIFHMAVVVSFGYYIVQWNAAAITKFFAICVGAWVTTVVLYDVLARRISVTRFLFGMKSQKSARHISTLRAIQGSGA